MDYNIAHTVRYMNNTFVLEDLYKPETTSHTIKGQ